jgi:hypothetical protein
MAEILEFKGRRRQASSGNHKIIKKLVEGKIIECIDLDDMTSAQREEIIQSTEIHQGKNAP